MTESAAEKDGMERARLRCEPILPRVDRNRRRLTAFLIAYVTLSSVLVATALVGGVYLAMALVAIRVGGSAAAAPLAWFTIRLPIFIGVTWIACAIAFGLWCLRVMGRPETALLERLNAVRADRGQYQRAKSCLHDAAIAAGMPLPRLAIIADGSLNAFVVARTPTTACVGITDGLFEALTADELRCVFAHLVARIRDGSARTATVLADIFDAAAAAGRTGDLLMEENSVDEGDGIGSAYAKQVFSPAIVVYGTTRLCLALTAMIILPGYQRAQAVTAECADSEGMLLAKDPRGMIQALEKVLPADNRPGDVMGPRFREDIFGALFFAWPTWSFADDPELVRIARLREVLGAEGAA